MASTYSTNLAIELIGTGDQAGTWGTTTNSNLGTLIEQSISGYVTQAVSTGTDTTITIPNGSTGVARNMYIELTGTGGASTNLIVPANKKLYFIFNNSTGAVTVKVSGQTGVSVPTGKKMVLVSNGTDIVNGLNYIADFATNSFTVTNLTASSGTITNLLATSGSITNLVSSDASATVLRAGSATLTHLSATSATITNLTLTSLVISNLSIASANITTLTSASATITNLLATSLAVSSIATFAAGSAAAPSITTTGDTNTGLFFPAADTIGFSEGGAEAMRIDASGNLGLGLTPSAWQTFTSALEVPGGALAGISANQVGVWQNCFYNSSSFKYKSTAAATLYQQAGAVHAWYNAASGTAGNTISFTQAMTLDASGNLGIGTTSPAGKLDIQSASGSGNTVLMRGGTYTNISFATGIRFLQPASTLNANRQFRFTSGDGSLTLQGIDGSGTDTSDMSLVLQPSGGNIGIGTTSPRFKLSIGSVTPTSTATPDTLDLGATFNSAAGAYVPKLRVYWDSGTSYGFSVAAGELLEYYTTTSGSHVFYNSTTERARISSSGDLLVGRTTTINSSKIVASGNSYGWVGTSAGVDGTYVDWFALAPYSPDTREQHRIRSSTSSIAANSGIQFLISDGGGSTAQTESFRINRTSCTVVGALSKGSGSFKIDHPLKPDTHHLVHSFIEGPQADLIYRGKATLVNGRAEVNIDTVAGMTEGTFVALCREVQCFTSNESDWDAVRGSVSGNKLTIECQNQSSSAIISWLVIGERQDKHMYETEWTDENGKVIVEPAKVTALESK